MSNAIAVTGIPTGVDNVNGENSDTGARSKVQSILLCVGIVIIVYIALVTLRLVTSLFIEIFILGNGRIVKEQFYEKLHTYFPKWFPNNRESNNSQSNTTGTAVESGIDPTDRSTTKSKHTNTRMSLIELILPGKVCTKEDIVGFNSSGTEGSSSSNNNNNNNDESFEKSRNNKKQFSTISDHTSSTAIISSFSDHSSDGNDDMCDNNDKADTTGKDETVVDDDATTNNNDHTKPISNKESTTSYDTESCTSHNDEDDDDDDNSGTSTTQCSICLQEIEVGDMIYTTRHCNHTYHVDCIRQWVTTPPTFGGGGSSSRHNPSLRSHLMSSSSAIRSTSDHQQQQQQNCSFNDIIINNDCPNCRTPLFGFDAA